MKKNKILFLVVLSYLIAFSIANGQTKLMCYNIKNDYQKTGDNNWNSRKEKMIQLFEYYEPSVIGVQEALLNQVEYINSSLPDFDYIGVGRDDGKVKGEYCAIFFDSTKFKVIEHSTFWLSDTPGKISVGWDAALERICTYGLFEDKKTKKRIWIFNTHFDHIGKLAREKSAELIVKKMFELNENNFPMLLMGDLNVVPEDQPINVFKSKLKDAKEISEKPFYGPVGTFNGFEDIVMDRRIDYFFTNNLKVLSYIHIDDRLNDNKFISDHLPVLISVEN